MCLVGTWPWKGPSRQQKGQTKQYEWPVGISLPWGAVNRDGSDRRKPRTVLSLGFAVFEPGVVWYLLGHPHGLGTAREGTQLFMKHFPTLKGLYGWIHLKWDCMRYLSIVIVLATVDGGQHPRAWRNRQPFPTGNWSSNLCSLES